MNKLIVLTQALNEYASIVMLYQEDGIKRLAHTFIYHGRDNATYLLFLYKDPMPKQPFLEAWNTLDDTSINITIVPEPTYKQSIDDFVACWSPEHLEESVELFEVDSFKEIEDELDSPELKDKKLLFFARKMIE